MRINNNLMALNAHRYMSQANSKQSKSLEKLSSGLAINSAADNAAGLAISEKMRAQINGLDQANANAQDGISMIQTAEGALQESENILQRMRELAVQSANDTNTTEDRKEIQKEIDQLSGEITRISESTEFNTKKLLDGTLEGKLHIGANEGQDLSVDINGMDAKILGVQRDINEGSGVIGLSGVEVASFVDSSVTTITYTALKISGAAAVTETTASVAGDTITITLAQAAGTSGAAGAITASADDVKTALESVAGEAGIVVSVIDGETVGTGAIAALPIDTAVSTTVDEEASKSYGINVSTQEAASDAITTINSAINSVSAERANLGAIQNRLDHTINNLSTTAENMTASESRIRDVDMAKEMMEYTKLGILQQASQAMLAQANQAPQGVLQLLQ